MSCQSLRFSSAPTCWISPLRYSVLIHCDGRKVESCFRTVSSFDDAEVDAPICWRKKGGLWLRQTPGYLARQVFLLSCRTAQCILLWFYILDLCTVVLCWRGGIWIRVILLMDTLQCWLLPLDTTQSFLCCWTLFKCASLLLDTTITIIFILRRKDGEKF